MNLHQVLCRAAVEARECSKGNGIPRLSQKVVELLDALALWQGLGYTLKAEGAERLYCQLGAAWDALDISPIMEPVGEVTEELLDAVATAVREGDGDDEDEEYLDVLAAIARQREQVSRAIGHGDNVLYYRNERIFIADHPDGWDFVWRRDLYRDLDTVLDSIDNLLCEEDDEDEDETPTIPAP
jgi:hypothetical protein